jgi:ubiquinone/menaquinone biosynthesis C-methylase UbiE
MASNKEIILAQYSRGTESNRATCDRSSSLEFYYTKKHLDGYIKPNDKVLEIGCGTGYYGLYFADKCCAYHGVDIVPIHIDLFNETIKEKGYTNISCALGDATNLENINDRSYDVVLCLGPLYHLPPRERELVFAECVRVCKNGGIIAFAYINKIGVYAGATVIDDRYPNEQANKCVLENGTDDLRPDTFFFTTPEELNAVASKYGLYKIKNLGTDFFVTMNIVNSMNDEQFEVMRPLYDEMTSHESCTGMSNHALLVCRK